MINYREILRLNALGYSQRSIATGAKASRNTVKDVLEKASEKNITWPLDEDITNADLEEILSDKQTTITIPYAVINYEYIHKELSKKGVTLTLLWQEYCERAYANGQKPYICERSEALHEYSVRGQVPSLGSCNEGNYAYHPQARRGNAG